MSRFVNLNDNMRIGSGGSESSGIFSRFKTGGGNLSTSTIVGIVVVFLFVLIGGIYIYNYYTSSKAGYKPNQEQVPVGSASGPYSQNSEAELMLFYVDWCPHCKTAKPVWDDLKSQYENKTINGYPIIFTEINCTQETAEVEQMMNKYNIEGFPTIKLLKDGQVIEYDAKPTKETLVQFLNTVL